MFAIHFRGAVPADVEKAASRTGSALDSYAKKIKNAFAKLNYRSGF